MAKANHLISTDRSLPHNLEAEKKVLGAMMRDQDALYRAQEILGDEAFYQPSHQMIYNGLIQLSSQNIAIDLLTLSEYLERRNELNLVGGAFYLAELAHSVVTSTNIEYHAVIVREHALRRKLIHQCTRIAQEAYESPDDAESLLSYAESEIFKLSQVRKGRSFEPVGKFLDTAIDKIQLAHQQKGTLTGLGSGFRDLDEMTTGFQASDLIILAARPSVGKTSLVLNFAENAAMAGSAVGVFSLEMSSEQIAERVLCAQARVNLKHMRSGFFTKRDAAQLLETANRIHHMPLYIDDTPNLNQPRSSAAAAA